MDEGNRNRLEEFRQLRKEIRQSGEHLIVRYALYQAALVASFKNRDVMIYYTNKIRGREREKGIHVKMRVKLAAKLLVIAWTLMKKREPFNPVYLKAELN